MRKNCLISVIQNIHTYIYENNLEKINYIQHVYGGFSAGKECITWVVAPALPELTVSDRGQSLHGMFT